MVNKKIRNKQTAANVRNPAENPALTFDKKALYTK
ncbi:MAG: hypothetical protein BWX77_00569 [Bacteroidetes bacterium ADurb.Bin090]|nr:MAG: hypothetical protein BWX77_00569 [Bacteroidetes bacterium ADurb.Bin090]